MSLEIKILNRGFEKLSSQALLHTIGVNATAPVASSEMLKKRLMHQKPLKLTDHSHDLEPKVQQGINKGVDLVSHFKKMKRLGAPGRTRGGAPAPTYIPEVSGLSYKGKF